MKKQTITKLLIGISTLIALTIAANNVGAWGKSNKWNDRMVKPEDPADKNKSTTNISDGKVTNPDGTAGGTETKASGDLLAYGEGTLHCRDAVLKVNTNFETGAGSATSAIKVTELSHGATKVISCASVSPTLVSNAGTPVNGGTITIKCGNGQLHVAASTCTAPSPTPTPVPTPTPTPTPIPTPTPTPIPAPPSGPQPTAGYTVPACSSYCSDAIYKCARSRGGKPGTDTITSYRSCQNGQAYFTESGQCGAVPTNCQ